MHEVCISHRIPRAWEQQRWEKEEETDTRITVEEYSVKYGTKGQYKGKSIKQGLISAKDLTIILLEGHESS